MKTIYVVMEYDEYAETEEMVGWSDVEEKALNYARDRSRQAHAKKVEESHGGIRFTVLPFDESGAGYWKFYIKPVDRLE